MNRQERILVVDDEERWRIELSHTLHQAGFQVDSVGTAVEALDRLRETFYHLLILDIRMENNDPSNTEGMVLLKELDQQNVGIGTATQVIMLSAYGTPDQMRTAFRDFKVADFASKDDFNNLEFAKQVQQLFIDQAQFNPELSIYWHDTISPDQVVLDLKLNGTQIKENRSLQARLKTELDDLLCRLFGQAYEIMVKPLQAGYSGAGILWVQPAYSNTGNGQAVVVKFGDFRKIDREWRNFQEFVQPFIGGHRSTAAINLKRTSLLGGIVYSFLGTADNQLQDFETFYRHETDVAKITAVLDCLFFDTCANWYANAGQLHFCDLTKDYLNIIGTSFETLQEIVTTDLTSVEGDQTLQFRLLNNSRMFRNPILAIAQRRLMRSTYLCVTHGDLNPRNILVDQTGHTWLIDFQHTGQSHILRDIAHLDSIIRFELLPAETATLAERFELEQALSSIDHFEELELLQTTFSSANPALAKAFAISIHLRKLAHQLINRNPHADLEEYHIASLYLALNTIRFTSLSLLQREHALLSASVLAERLNL